MARNIKSLKGMQVGSLIALEPTTERVSGHVVWKWKCIYCDNILTGTENQIKRIKDNPSGKFHCKCDASTKNLLSGKAKDIKGTVIGTLIAVSPTMERYENQGTVIWNWRCLQCGNVITGTFRQIKRSKHVGKYRCYCVEPKRTNS